MGRGRSHATPPSDPGIGVPASEEKPGEQSALDTAVALSNQQQQISALTDMVRSMGTQLFELHNLNQRSTVPVDLPNSSLAGGRRPLPTLSDMSNGLSVDSYFSGKNSEHEGVWDVWFAKIRPSLRHPSLALLLSESTPIHVLRENESYLEEANKLFYDFLCRVPTGTANTIVRSFESNSDGQGDWLALSKLRRNNRVVYFINQVDKLFLQTNQLATLAPPLPAFLEGKETLRRIHDYSVNTRVTPSGKPLCMETVETMYTAMAVVRLHPDYMLLKAKFMVETLPTSNMLADQVTSHYDTILAPRAAVTHTANAVDNTDDNPESEAADVATLLKTVSSSVEKREAFFKKASPSTKTAILKRVADYEKHGKLPKPGEHLGAAAGQSELYPGLEESGEVLFALQEAGQSDLHPGLGETGEDIYAGREEEHSDLHSGLAETGHSYLSDSLHRCPTPYQLWTSGRSSVPEESPFSVHPVFNYYSVLAEVCEPEVAVSGTAGEHTMDCESTVYAPHADSSSAQQSPRRPKKKHHCHVPNKHASLLNRHNPIKTVPIYDSWVYIDVITAFFPDKARLERTQARWDGGHDQHLGDTHQISPRQLWFKPGLQGWHTVMMAGSMEIYLRAQYILDRGTTLPRGVEHVISVKKIVCKLHVIRQIADHMDMLLKLEPVMVRTSLEDLQRWASGLGETRRALIRAVEDFGSLLFLDGGWGTAAWPDYSDSGSDCGDDHPDQDGCDSVDSSDHGGVSADRGDSGFVPALDSSDYGHDLADRDEYSSLPGLICPSDSGDDFDDSIPDLESASDSDSDDDGDDFCGSIPDLESASDSDSDGMSDFCGSIPDLDSGSDSGNDGDYFDDHRGDNFGDSIPDLDSGSDSYDDIGPLPSDAWAYGVYCAPDAHRVQVACRACAGNAGPRCAVGKCAVLDSGSTKHIFNSVQVFNADYDTELLGAHCIPGQPFNLLSVVALEDAGFLVDFGARTVSKGGGVFSFARIGNQYIMHEDTHSTLDTHLACAVKHAGDQRDRFDWKFEDTEPHFTTHGPFFLELVSSEDNHILDDHCTLADTCFVKDWAGKHCYGNPPFDHDIILKCLQKALADFDRDPPNTKFMFILPKWVTASWSSLTSRFSVVHEYPAGAKIFSAPMASCYNVANLEPCGEDRVWIEDTKWPVVVFFKDSQTVEQLDLKMLQHVRLGHVGDKSVDHMFAQNVPMGITESQYSCSPVQHCPERCIACKLTKAIRPSMKPTGREPSEELGSLVWSDTCGPFRISAGGYRWFALFVDDSTTWICIFFLKHKSNYLEAFKLYLVEVKRPRSSMGLSSDYHMILHTDGDSTMIAGQTAAFCKQHGIEQRHGSPYLHEKQARVERSHRDVQAMARALLLTSGFGVEMWPLATRHAVFILNRIFRKSLGWTSAYYRIQKKHADLTQLRVFGCRAYPFIDPTVREHKLSNRARGLRYVGHSEVSFAYLLYDHESGKVVNSGMVTFSERLDKLGKVVTTWDPSAVTPLKTNFMATALDAPYRDPPPALLEAAVLEQGVYLPEDGDEVMAVVKVETSDGMCWVSLSSYLEPGGERLSLLRACPTYAHVNVHYPLFTEVRAVTGKGDSEEAMISGRAIAPHAQPYCVVLLTNFTIMDLPAGDVQFPPAHACLGVQTDVPPTVQSSLLPEGVTEPKSHSQVLISPDCAEWLDSIQDELEALVQIKRALLMMDEEDVPAGVRLLDMSLVLKVKLDKHRQLPKRKSRICVRGNKQEYGVDYYDTFAPCTQLSSVRIVIVLALNLGLVVYHMDVDTAFLNSVLEEDLYVRLPRGLVYGGHRCAKLLKAVYGPKQAGREWFATSDAFIMGYDSRMQRSDVEPCLYFIRDAGIMVIILAYVDDYLVATNDTSWYDAFVTTFHSQYACKDLGVLDLVMGIGVRWGDDTAYLSQSGYISQMISTYGLDDAKPATLPMSPGTALSPADGKDVSLPYRALLGQLQWMVRCSRPDIMAAVSILSRFCTTYGPEHFVALKQVVRYLKGTREYELVLRTASVPGGCGTGRSRPLPLSIYTDADYAGCKTSRRSTSGIVVFLCGSLVIFSSMIQKCVSLSTTEAEIIAMSEGAREVKYVLNVLDSLVDICRPVPMYCDNQGAIHLASDYVNNSRSKHIEVRNMYIRELIKAKETE
eukprot:gene17987-biopygen18566